MGASITYSVAMVGQSWKPVIIISVSSPAGDLARNQVALRKGRYGGHKMAIL